MDFENLDILKKYFKNIEFSQDRKKVYALLLDYFNGDSIQVNRMMKGYDAGIDKIFINKNCDDISINKIAYYLINAEDIREDRVLEIIDFWGLVLNFKNNTNIKSDTKKNLNRISNDGVKGISKKTGDSKTIKNNKKK